MKKFYLSLVAMLLTCFSAFAADYRIDESKAITADAYSLDGVTAVVTDPTGTKTWAAFSGGDGQDINANFTTVLEWSSKSEYSYIKFFAAEGQADDVYYIKLVNANGDFYVPKGGWHDGSGCLNVTGNGGGLFVGGLNNQEGQDAPNGALWKVTKTEDGYTLYNIGKERYAIPGVGVQAGNWSNALKLYSEFEEYDAEAEGDFSGRLSNDKAKWNGANGVYAGAVERYEGGGCPEGVLMSQTITDLPAGVYEVTFNGIANVARDLDLAQWAGDDKAYVFANDETKDITIGSKANLDQVDWTTGTHTLRVSVSDGTLVYGIGNNVAAGQWYVCKAISLTRIGDLPSAPVVAIEEGEGVYTVTSTSADAALYYLCKPYSWLDERETPELVLQNEIEAMGSMIDSEATWDLYDHMGMQPAPKTFTVADYQEVYAGEEMFLIAANVGWDGEKLAVISNIEVKDFTVPGAPEAPEVTSLTVNPNAQIVAISFDAEDAAPTYNVSFVLETEEGTAVNTTVAGEFGQDYGDMIYTFGAPLEAGNYVLVLPAGSMTFSRNGDPFNAEIRVPFTVEGEEPKAELAVSLVAEDETEYALNTHSTVTVDMPLIGIVVTGLDQVMDEVTYAILGKNKTTVASGTLSVNTIGYAEFPTLVNLYEGNDYQIVVATKDSTLFDCAVIGAAEPAEIEISATLDGEISINSHSEVSVEKASSIEVTFDGVVPTEAGYLVVSMKNVETEEGLLWEVGEVLEQGILSLNGKGYAEFEQTQYFEAGTKYTIAVMYKNAAGQGAQTNFVINGAYGSAPELADGTYYIQNVESGLFMAGNNSWGTQASAVATGDEFAVTLADGVYTITGTSLTSANKTLGYNLFVDTNVSQNGNTWTIAPVEGEEGVYTIYGKGMKDKVEDAFDGYIAQSETAGAVAGYVLEGIAEITDAAKWRFVTKADLTAEIAAGDDVTYLISNANFTRNHATSAWIVDEGCTNKNLGGGENSNFCAESYHSAFNIHQTIENAPNGFYTLTAQGFYRNDFKDGETHEIPVFYANSEEIAIPEKTGEENSMSDASRSFTKGLYAIDPIQFEVTDGTITIGVKSDEAEYWCIWDNFQLTYLGEEAPAEIAVTLVANDSVEYLLNTHSVVTIDQPISAIKVAGLDQVQDSVTYAIYGMDKATLAAGLLSVNTIGYAEFAPVTLYEGNQYNVVVTVGENTVFDQIVIGAAEPAEIEIAATINDSIALNTHSAISAESIKVIEVSFDGFTPTQAGFSINTLVQVADSAAESSSWEIGETLAQGVLSLNGKGYVELEEAIVLNAGTKYCVIINADNQSATFEINGAAVIELADCDLTKEMFLKYYSNTTGEALETPETIGCDYNVGVANSMIYGLSTVKWYAYADVTGYDKLVISVAEGTPRLMYNREIDPDKTPEADGVKHVEIVSESPFLTIVDCTDGSKNYVYDLKAMAAADPAKPFVHINAIKGFNFTNAIITGMKLFGTAESAEEYLTGISSIATASKANGKYIENGKVVIVKNGVKYNVAGSIIK